MPIGGSGARIDRIFEGGLEFFLLRVEREVGCRIRLSVFGGNVVG